MFDSLNGQSKGTPSSKPLKGGVTRVSEHENFWKNSLEVLKTMRFFCCKKNKFVTVPSVKNLYFTLQGFLYLKTKLLEEKNFSYIMTGSFNQDPLENFFSYLRSYGFRNTNPDVSHFVSSFQSLLVNNFMSAHSPYSNCEEDTSSVCLNNLRSFLCGEFIAGVQPLEEGVVENTTLASQVLLYKKVKVARCITTYISGYVARFLLKSFGRCVLCKKNICFQENASDHDYIVCREYNKSHLIRSGTFLNYCVTHSLELLFYIIPRFCDKLNIPHILYDILKQSINSKPLNCPQHDVSNKFYKFVVRCSLFWWCKSVNKILKGKDGKFINFLASKPNLNRIDPMKILASKKYNAKLKMRKKHSLR